MENVSPTPAELVNGITGLVTLPDIYLRINQLVEDPKSTLYDIAAVISKDPAFTAHLLRTANSSFYGFSSSIDTVLKAVSVIGTSQIRNLALSLSVSRTFAGLPNSLVSMENFWRHSLYCGLAARILAKQAKKCDPEALFTAALLHDVGELIMFNRMPEQAKAAIMMVLDSADMMPVYQAEQQVFGFDHAAIGGELAKQWNLPPLLGECIRCHHQLELANRYKRETALVQIANLIALMAELDSTDVSEEATIQDEAWQLTGLDPDEVIEPVMHEVQEAIGEAQKLFLGA